MKRLLSIIFFLLVMNFCFSQSVTLYNKGGVKFSYTESVVKSYKCPEDNMDYKLVTIRYTISNTSGKLAYVEYDLNVTGLGGNVTGCAFNANINLEQSSYNLSAGSTDKIKNGDEVNGVIGGWIKTGASPSWHFYTRFYDSPTAKTKNEQPVSQKINSNKSANTIKIDQDDYKVNPEDPNKKANELKKIKEQQDLEKQAYQNVLNAERNQQAQQAHQQKQIADDNKKKQDEYNKQQQIKAEKARNEQTTIEQNYTNSLNNTANNQKELNNNLNDFSNSYLDKQKNERQEQENNSIQYEKNLQNEKLNSGGYTSVTCSQCDGNGSIKCSECNGKGGEKCIYCSGKGKNNCGYCQGTKVWNNATCVFCGGEGVGSPYFSATWS